MCVCMFILTHVVFLFYISTLVFYVFCQIFCQTFNTQKNKGKNILIKITNSFNYKYTKQNKKNNIIILN